MRGRNSHRFMKFLETKQQRRAGLWAACNDPADAACMQGNARVRLMRLASFSFSPEERRIAQRPLSPHLPGLVLTASILAMLLLLMLCGWPSFLTIPVGSPGCADSRTERGALIFPLFHLFPLFSNFPAALKIEIDISNRQQAVLKAAARRRVAPTIQINRRAPFYRVIFTLKIITLYEIEGVDGSAGLRFHKQPHLRPPSNLPQ